MQRSLPFTSTFTLCIHELFERRWRRLDEHGAVVGGSVERARAGAGRSPMMYSGASSTVPVGVSQHLVERAAPSGRGRCRAAAP